MASYLRSWLPSSLPLSSSSLAPEPESSTTPTAPTIELAEDDDAPPAFPALDSAQRTSIPEKSSTPHILSDDALMPPPPVPPVGRLSQLGAPSSLSGGSLMPPPSTNKAPTRSPAQKKREKVALAPGHSPLDWANLKNSGADLRAGATQLMRIPPSVLKQHNKRGDAWSAFNGKVYNITPYIDFHPGGAKELMRVAGRDGTKLFALTHSWVNLDYMLDACLVGFLVPEPLS